MSAATETNTARELLPTATPGQSRRAVRAAVGPHKVLAVGATITLVGGSVAALLVPPIIGHIVDLVRDGRGPGSITAPTVLLAVLALAQALLTSYGQLLVAQLGETTLATLRERVVERALRLPVDRVERAGSGDLVARVSGDVAVIATAARTVLPVLAGAGLTVGLTIVGLAVLDWRLALAALVAAPVQAYTLYWYLGRAPRIFAQERVAEGTRTQQLLDSVGGAPTVRAFRLGGAHVEAVRRRSAEAVDISVQTNRILTRFFGRLNLAEVVGLGAILLTGFWLVGAGTVSVGTAAAAALYFHRLFDPINTLLALVDDLQEATAGLARLVGILDVSEAPPPAHPHEPSDASVAVTDVDFGYVADRPVLRDVSLQVGAGEHVALVGVSGAGKTTLAKLVAGLADPGSGTVRLGGVVLTELEDLRRQVALVTQEVHVFTGSVADDLRLAAPRATDDQVRAALDLVGASGWVAALPDGLATEVGEGGAALTAAQGQQLALARLVLADPPVAVLDEATADAGSAGARQLDRAASAALRGRTALVVAHRLSQAAAADRIVVLDNGRVVETGTHVQLREGNGPYARLWRAWAGSRLADADT